MQPPEDAGAALRVVVRNKISLANFLPARQRAIIARIHGVEAVSPFTWFGGKFKNEEGMSFAQSGMDTELLRPIFGEAKMDGVEYRAFENEQTARRWWRQVWASRPASRHPSPWRE